MSTSCLLLEPGSYLLHQNGDRMLLEQDEPTAPAPVIGQYRGYVVVLRTPLTGVRQRLSGILVEHPDLNVPLRQITLSVTTPVTLFAAGAPDVDGFVLATGTRLTLGPFSRSGPLRLTDLDVLGTGALWVTAVTF